MEEGIIKATGRIAGVYYQLLTKCRPRYVVTTVRCYGVYVSEAKPRELSLAGECGRATAADMKYRSPLVEDSTFQGLVDARFQEGNALNGAIK